jgi:hypothetical protein
MFGPYSLIGRRRRLAASALVRALGILLPAVATHAETTLLAPGGVEVTAQAPITSNSDAAIAQASVNGTAAAAPTADDASIRPFPKIRVSDETLADLRRRIAETKWPKQETVTEASQGVQLATMRKLAS